MAISADIQQQIYDILSRASNLSFINAEQEPVARLGLTPGQQIRAEILTLLPNNRTQVQVGTERFNLELPMPVRQGQTLEMTFISETPRTTFAIARPGGMTQQVRLSDASRLLGLLVGSEQVAEPALRSSLQSIGEMLRRSTGEAGVLANLMEEALTYGVLRDAAKASPQVSGDLRQTPRNEQGAALQQQGGRMLSPDQTRLAAFEANATQILQHIARNSRFTLVEAANQPVPQLPLMPGEEFTAVVTGTLPGGRAFVQAAGTTLELSLPRAVQTGDILRLTFIASQPKPLFALPHQPVVSPGTLSEAGRWLSILEHGSEAVSKQQLFVLDRLNSVLNSLPPDSPAFTAILDEAVTYQTALRGRQPQEQSSAFLAAQQAGIQLGNGIVLSDDMARLLQTLIRGNRLALLEEINQRAFPPGLQPGQHLKGEVLSAAGEGRFLVQVAGQTMEFSLPKGIAKGDILSLFFINSQPQPSFLMTRFGQPGDARMSETSRWLNGFIKATAEFMPAREAMGTPRILLSAPPTEPEFLSRVLRQGLMESGLFYESHLARWFSGEYPLEDILREPQGRLSPAIRQALLQNSTGENSVLNPLRTGMTSGSPETVDPTGTKARPAPDQNAALMMAQQTGIQQGNGVVLSDDMAKLLQTLIRGNRLAFLEELNQRAFPPGLQPGQQVQGEVLSEVGKGRFLVQVAGQSMEFNLPGGAVKGDMLSLFFINSQPQPSFLLTRSGQPGDARTSETGRWLSSFLSAAASQVSGHETMELLRKLLPEPPVESKFLSRVFQQGLKESGLFSESFLARWFPGEDVPREPHGKLPPALHQTVPLKSSEDTAARDLVRAGMNTGSLEAMETALKKAGREHAPEDIADKRTFPVVREQLQALQTGQVMFRGELFPGQPLELTVTERDARRGDHGEREQSWETALRLDLARLGGITARLSLDGERVSVDLRVSEPSTASLLEADRARLADQLGAAGLSPGEIRVRHETA